MYRKKFITIFRCILISCCITLTFPAGEQTTSIYAAQKAQASSITTNEPLQIRLANSHFDPLRKIPAAIGGFNRIQAFAPSIVGYYIVQFDGPIQNSWKKRLKGLKADIFDYVPDYAFIIRMNSNKEKAVRRLPHVRWLGIYQPSYKISQPAADAIFIKPGLPQGTEQSLVLLNVIVFPGEDTGMIISEIEGLGSTVIDMVTTKWKTTLKINIPSGSISGLADISGVRWIEPVPEWKLFNNVSTDIIAVRTPRDAYGLYGEGQTVGVCDTGLDQGSISPANLHDDFEDGSGVSRVIQIIDRVGDGPSDVRSGHGTHVSGSVLGNGINSGSSPLIDSFPSTSFAGSAPKASLILQAVENNSTGYLTGIPIDLTLLFDEAYSAGADLHTNSWGSAAGSAYTSYSEGVDQYVWDHKDFLILFAAGNEGVNKDGDGIIDLYNIGSPATAKNCLTVGATEGNRPSGAGYDFPWGTGSWALMFSADPIFTDHISDNPDGMAAFSSRGPLLDGRYKPDIAAPGTNILSTKSSMISGNGWGPYDSNYMYMGGTSMAAPLTAGTAALMREYLINVVGFTGPSAALIKAALLNSAEDITPGQYGTGLAQEIPDSPVPNDVDGWGRLNLANGVYPAAPFDILYYYDQAGLNTDDFQDYSINVTDPGSSLKINLVWTDYPGSAATQGGLVNDLDLQVTDPSAAIHYPDGASQKTAVNTLAYDDGTRDTMRGELKWAMKFTPSSYPANLESTTFYFNNPYLDGDDVAVVVYDDDGAGGLPGTELFRKTLIYVPSGWITVGISGVTVTLGDFYVVIEKNTAAQYLYVDNGNPSGRCYNHDGANWVQSYYTAYIRANIRGTDYSTSFDRVNNVLGLTIDNPAAGAYTIRVSGYNIPQGPQPYAMVLSGNVSSSLPAVYYYCDDDTDGYISSSVSGTCTGTGCEPAGCQIVAGNDCDDGDSTIYPGTPELCDGKSNDCNDPGIPDGSGEGWYGAGCDGPDLDFCEEGIYECNGGIQNCTDATADDIEVCDGLDNDCDGSIDEGFDNDGDTYTTCNGDCDDTDPAINPETYWYQDSDEDGYGDPSVFIQQCLQPEAYVLNNTDCDDNDAFLYPGGPPVRISGETFVYYSSLQTAYNEVADGGTIQSKAEVFTENIDMNVNKSVTLKGGYDCSYAINTGLTILNGNLTISNGTTTIENFTLQ